jgi:Icc-related predicted phosphoesterase
MPRVVYLSDVHIEINGLGRLNCTFAEGDILILAGDIFNGALTDPRRTDKDANSFRKAVDHLKKDVFPKYKKVFKVMGNHSHYNGVFKETETKLRTFFSDVSNLFILENTDVYTDGVLFIGCTLWTSFFNGSPIAMMQARNGMNDYRLILEKAYEELDYIERAKWNNHKPFITPELIYNVHRESVNYITETLEKHKDLPTVIITHHPMSLQSIKNNTRMSPLTAAFASELDQLILDNPQIKYHVHGHTHYSKKYRIGDTHVVSNQCGYYSEPCYYQFKPDEYFDVEGYKGNDKQ